jgi:hypothetical protein
MVQVLVKKKFHQRNCKQLRGQTGRAKDVTTGNLFNAFNAEQRAAEAGTNINALSVI